MNIPILGICYGMQIICQTLGGKVQSSNRREFGKAEIKILKKNLLFNRIVFSKNNASQVWMSHGDEVVDLPKGFDALAKTKANNIAAIGNIKKNALLNNFYHYHLLRIMESIICYRYLPCGNYT